MRSLAIVPARGGSKRLPRKNVKLLQGKPLIYYTLEAVKNSGVFDTILLSSDDEEILELGAKIEDVIPEKRQDQYATDSSKVIELVKSIADRPELQGKYDCIGLFLPTCPFRTARNIKEGFAMLTANDFSVVSVTEMSESVQLAVTLGENRLMNKEVLFHPSPLVAGNTRSQDLDKFYRINGGFYIAWWEKLRERNNFFDGQVKAYVMDRMNSVDIDDEVDFMMADFLLQKEFVALD